MAMNEIINVRLDKRTKERIKEVAKLLNISMTDVVRLVLDGNLDIWQPKPEIKLPGKGDRA